MSVPPNPGDKDDECHACYGIHLLMGNAVPKESGSICLGIKRKTNMKIVQNPNKKKIAPLPTANIISIGRSYYSDRMERRGIYPMTTGVQLRIKLEIESEDKGIQQGVKKGEKGVENVLENEDKLHPPSSLWNLFTRRKEFSWPEHIEYFVEKFCIETIPKAAENILNELPTKLVRHTTSICNRLVRSTVHVTSKLKSNLYDSTVMVTSKIGNSIKRWIED